MSDGTGVISSTSAVGSAIEVAPASSARRSLANLGAAIQRGELTPASSILTAFFKANPNFIATFSGPAASTDSLSQHLQALKAALSGDQASAAQAAWEKVKADLTPEAVTHADHSSNPENGSAIFTATDGKDKPEGKADLPDASAANQLTYQPGGSTAPAETVAGKFLDTAA